MAIEITVPRLGWSMEEGSFCRWLKADGEMVREGDGLFELEGDKATQVVESFDAGILRIAANGPKEGEVVKVGQLLGVLEPRSKKAASKPADDSASKVAPQAQARAASAPRSASQQATPPKPAPAKTVPPSPVVHQGASRVALASPSVRRLARELGVDLQALGNAAKYQVSASDLLGVVVGQSSPAAAASTRSPSAFKAATNGGAPVTPRARRVAGELGVDPSHVSGTGRNGRVREADVRQAAENPRTAAPTPSSQTPLGVGEPIPQLRRVIAQRMMAASHETAPVTLTARADAAELVRFRDECKRTAEERGVKAPSFTELFVKLSAAALEKHPRLMGQWAGDRIVGPDGVHIAVAVDTAHGLVTPVLRDVPAMSLREMSAKLAELVELARSRRLAVEQMHGGAFTVSSLGGYRVEAFTPILNPPQTAILGVGRISKQPVVKQGELAVGEVVALSLTFDHRVIDGAPAAAFLTSLCEVIENPLAWLLA